MDIVESIDDIQVQYPPEGEFSSADLQWTKFGTAEHHDDVAKIPYDRVEEFIIGECSNVEYPTRFHIERGRKRSRGSLKEFKIDEYLEYRLYWCSFGPENYGEGGGILPSRRYRLNTRNRAARPQSMRGCTCHFVVKRLYAHPSLALIIYNERRHVNKSGVPCHGALDRDALGPGAKKVPYICSEIQQQTLSMIYLGIPEENVVQKHLEGIQRYCGSDAKVNNMASQYVQKLGMIIKRSTHELDLDDQASIRLWVDRNKKSVFFYQDSSEADPFILGIQTEWQLQQMVRFGHRSIMAADSTFGIKKLRYPLCTLLVFDSRQHALPVAWVITRSFAKPDILKWLKALVDRVRTVDIGWMLSTFVIDDAAADLDPIRDVLSCPVLFSLWRVRRSWLKNVVKKCSGIEIQREIFIRLGGIVQSIWNGLDSAAAVEDFIKDFADQTAFMQFFKDFWLPKIEMWLSMMQSLPRASQEASGAIEAYHVKLKSKLYEDSYLDAFQRVDWLAHKLTAEVHSCYWLDRYADEHDTFQNVKETYIASTSWYRALQIPDTAVYFDEKDNLFAKVQSQKDSNISHVVWNPGSEFAFCDCAWSLRGNLCKHIMKVNMMCENRLGRKSSMSYHSFSELLTALWRKPLDDSIELDKAMALTRQILDQVQRLVELTSAKDICTVVDNLPLKWASRKARTAPRKPLTALALASTSRNERNNCSARKNYRKRRRLSRLR
uniref:SWIM-type domain-containing protein n=2 Tax=Opuntia streptacantha TaxID=393608 RepID=A0A7C9AJD9_OPUST